ncbi:MAG: hypothetical protein OK474_05015 [Thaumarchaeota archaeon]|nr:hypothetical protein [Nitrososphaerota archaeon]
MTDGSRFESEVAIALAFLVLLLAVPLGIGFLLQANIDNLYALMNEGLEQALIIVDLALIGAFVYFFGEKILPPGQGQQIPPSTPMVPEAPPGKPPVIIIPTNPPEIPPTMNDEVPPGCIVKTSWLLALMDMTIYPNNRVIGNIYKYSKTTKAGAYEFRTPYHQALPLRVEASDYHTLVQECSCPGVPGDISKKTFTLPAKVKILWEIVSGEGSFVKISGGDGSRTESGDEVIFDPPEIYKPEPDFDPPDVKKVSIRVTVYHDDPTKPPEHDHITSFINMEIRRSIEKEAVGRDRKKDEYVYDYWVEEGRMLTGPEVPEVTGDCIPQHTWLPGSPIEGRITLLPTSCKAGDLVRLEAFGTDSDQLELQCVPSGKVCKLPSSLRLQPNDNLSFFWQCDSGTFPLGAEHGGDTRHDLARDAVWRAPDAQGPVKFRLLISDSSRQYSDKALHLEGEIFVEGGKLPPSPVVAPPPVVPPPPHTKEEEGECKIEFEEKKSPFLDDVSVSRWWDDSTSLTEAIDKSVKERRTWNSEDLGTAVAISDGSSVGGSVAAGAGIRILEGEQSKFKRTEKLVSSAKGTTELGIKIEAPSTAKTAISAAAIAGLEAKASVLDVPEWLYETVEKEGLVAGTAEAGEQLWNRKEIVHLIKELLKEGTKKAGEAAAEGVAILGARLIEEIGKRVLLNGKVEVKAEGAMTLRVGTCVTDPGPVGVEASREFEMKNGELEEPHDGEFERGDVKFARSSCSAERSLSIEIEGDVTVEGSAYDGGEGHASLNSLWAAAWVVGCQHGSMSNGEAFRRESYYGCKFEGWFTLPQDKLEEYSEDDAGNLRHMVENILYAKLQEMVGQANITSPLDDPKAAEEELKEVLADWLRYVQEEWNLFTS